MLLLDPDGSHAACELALLTGLVLVTSILNTNSTMITMEVAGGGPP